MDIDQLSPEAEIVLTLVDANARRDAIGFLAWKAKQDGYLSRPQDFSIALDRYRTAMPQCFADADAKPSAFEAWKRQKGAA